MFQILSQSVNNDEPWRGISGRMFGPVSVAAWSHKSALSVASISSKQQRAMQNFNLPVFHLFLLEIRRTRVLETLNFLSLCGTIRLLEQVVRFVRVPALFAPLMAFVSLNIECDGNWVLLFKFVISSLSYSYCVCKFIIVVVRRYD